MGKIAGQRDGSVGTVPAEKFRELVHDLRNPLVAAFGFLSLLERSGPGPAAERYTCALRESMEAMRQILEQARAVYGGGSPIDMG